MYLTLQHFQQELVFYAKNKSSNTCHERELCAIYNISRYLRGYVKIVMIFTLSTIIRNELLHCIFAYKKRIG